MKLLYDKGKKALFKVPYQINLCIRVPCMENGKIEHQLPANTPPVCKVIEGQAKGEKKRKKKDAEILYILITYAMLFITQL